MPAIRVTGRDGSVQTLQAATATPLMETLRDARLGVDGTCGGACSCGTCHVYVDSAWIARLPPKSEDETMMLEALADFVTIKPGSRLSCQIAVDEGLDGLTVEVAPDVE